MGWGYLAVGFCRMWGLSEWGYVWIPTYDVAYVGLAFSDTRS